MISGLQWIYLVIILAVAGAGGFLPLARPQQARATGGFPLGEAFSSGVFLALSLAMLLPASFQIFRAELPELNYPVASVIAIVAFLVLLAIEHRTLRFLAREERERDRAELPAVIPIVMTATIAVPSFFLGASLGISESAAATLIFIAIILHKGSASFALALAMVRSTLSRAQVLTLFALFACTTPLGILAGGVAHEFTSGTAALLKATILSVGAGTFLYMGTLHEMQHSALIEHCSKRSCFLAMLAGLLITALVRLIVGEVHAV